MGEPAEPVLRQRLAALSLEQKIRLLTGADFWALHAEPAIGLRRLVTSDGPAGVRGETWDERDTSANVPSPTALAATWDEARVQRLGRLLAAEARRKGVDVLLAPTVNLHRTPYGGRHFECFSEDPLLTARIGVAYVRGLQSQGVAATVKHFVANDSETERFTLDAQVDERSLRELYLAPFEAIVRDAGVWAVMAGYNGVNGATMTESPMVREVLKDEWGFDGVVMSDWFAARSTEAAARGGLDLVMPGPGGPWGPALTAAVRAGAVAATVIDDKVLRILRLAARVGALEGVEPAAPAPAPWSDTEIAAELRATAAAGFVLARNTAVGSDPMRLLPLDPNALDRVAVLGPNAAATRTLGGGSATVYPPYAVSVLAGLQAALGTDRVSFATGVRSTGRPAVAAPPLVSDGEEGADGVEVRLLTAGGEPIRVEHRRTGEFRAMGSFGPGIDSAAVVAVELRATVRAATTGEHQLGCSGLGRFRLTRDDRELLAVDLRLPPDADPAAVLHPPLQTVPVHLAAGERLPIVLRHEVDPAAAATTFALLVEPPHLPAEEELAHAVELAREASVAVVVVGTTEEVESEGFDRETLDLPGRQDLLVRAVVAANPRTVVVVNSGAPVLLPWFADVPAVLLSWFPGQEAGNAVADVLLGAAEPGGRLPTSWPADPAGLPATTPVDGVLTYAERLLVGYRGYDAAGRTPLLPFGHGLGFTSWEYLTLQASGPAGPGQDITVAVRLRNTGGRRGREVVQVYAGHPGGRPPRSLVGFTAVEGDPGETVTATVELSARALEHWDEQRCGWSSEADAVTLTAAGSSGADGCTAQLAPGP